HVLHAFERAMLESDAERRRAWLTFVVVGGGPTGVEMAGALSELIRLVLVKDYPRLNVKDVRVLLLEATDRLLGPMPARLREAAAEPMWGKAHVGAPVAGNLPHQDAGSEAHFDVPLAPQRLGGGAPHARRQHRAQEIRRAPVAGPSARCRATAWTACPARCGRERVTPRRCRWGARGPSKRASGPPRRSSAVAPSRCCSS